MESNRTAIVMDAASLHNLADAVPAYALKCIEALESAGYEAWLVGGFVRDSLLRRPISDVDIATSACWQDVKVACEACGYAVHETGTTHGTVSVIIDYHVIEVTTYRVDGSYYDHRHPDGVTQAETIVEDLARRDFTINALAFHPRRGLVDPFGGTHDLKNHIIRAVGDPLLRLTEDALRIMRALRFASQLGFELSSETKTAVFERKQDLDLVAGERLSTELEKFLCGSHVRETLMTYSDVLAVILPELSEMKGLDQRTRYHCYDVLEHTAYVIEYVPQSDVLGRWAALFHDMGKPETFFVDEAGVGHMYGHEAASVGHLSKAAYRLRFPAKMTHNLKLLVRHHDFRPTVSRKNVRKLYAMLEFKDELFPVMCNLMRADALAHAPEYHARTISIDELEALFIHMKQTREALCVSDLAIDGKVLLELGLTPGPLVGDILEDLFMAVAEEKIANEPHALRSYAALLIASTNHP